MSAADLAKRQSLERARELVSKAAQRDAKVPDRDLYDHLLKQARTGGPDGCLYTECQPAALSMHKRLKPHAEAGHAHEVPKQQKKRASAMTTDQWLAAKIVAEQPASVADIGCGFGLTAALIAQQCHARVYGLNASKVATEAGQRFWQEAQLDNPPALQQALEAALRGGAARRLAAPAAPFSLSGGTKAANHD